MSRLLEDHCQFWKLPSLTSLHGQVDFLQKSKEKQRVHEEQNNRIYS